MNIALLISGINDEGMSRFLLGAAAAAADLRVRLSVYAGSVLGSASHKRTEDNGQSQPAAVFDFIDKSGTDVILADIGGIGEGVALLNREKFLNGFEGIPLLVLSETEGYPQVNLLTDVTDEHRGYSALCDAVSFCQKKELSEPVRVRGLHTDPLPSQPAALLQQSAGSLLHSDYLTDNPYDEILQCLIPYGVTEAALFLFAEAQENSLRDPFEVPEKMLALSVLENGKTKHYDEAVAVSGNDPYSVFSKESAETGTFILRSLYIGSRQIGLLLVRFTPMLSTAYTVSFFTDLATSAIRIIAGEEQILRLRQTIRENEAEMERDDSVLDRFSSEDTLTNSLNRHGFFGEAYDLLKQKFHEGAFAVVAYIDLDSIKSINTFFGREEGNKAMRRVAGLLKEVFGDEAIVGRIRGDEFAVLLVTDEEGHAATLRAEMSEQNTRLMSGGDQPYSIHLQFAVCEFRYSEGLSLKEMLAETDDNLQKMSRF